MKTSLATDTNTISYNISKNSVLVLTADGKYMITSLADNVAKKPMEIKIAPDTQLEQVIILNSNDLQFTEMDVDCQEMVVDDKA